MKDRQMEDYLNRYRHYLLEGAMFDYPRDGMMTLGLELVGTAVWLLLPEEGVATARTSRDRLYSGWSRQCKDLGLWSSWEDHQPWK